jgi:hypothetical protein
MAPEVAVGVFERTLTLLKGVAAEAEYVNGTLENYRAGRRRGAPTTRSK